MKGIHLPLQTAAPLKKSNQNHVSLTRPRHQPSNLTASRGGQGRWWRRLVVVVVVVLGMMSHTRSQGVKKKKCK